MNRIREKPESGPTMGLKEGEEKNLQVWEGRGRRGRVEEWGEGGGGEGGGPGGWGGEGGV